MFTCGSWAQHADCDVSGAVCANYGAAADHRRNFMRGESKERVAHGDKSWIRVFRVDVVQHACVDCRHIFE